MGLVLFDAEGSRSCRSSIRGDASETRCHVTSIHSAPRLSSFDVYFEIEMIMIFDC